MKNKNLITFFLIMTNFIQTITSEIISPYRVLGTTPFNSLINIKKIYKDLSVKHHPDRSRNTDKKTENKDLFVEFQNAFESIKKVREKFDEYDYITIGFIFLNDFMDFYGIEDYYYRLFIELFVQGVALVLVAVTVYTFKNFLRKIGILPPKNANNVKMEENKEGKKENDEINKDKESKDNKDIEDKYIDKDSDVCKKKNN